MRVLGVSLIVLGLALAALTATAQESGQTTFTLVAKSQGGSFVWTDAGGAVNPTLTVPASTEVTITAKQGESDGIPHNIKVGANAVSSTFSEMDESTEYKFTSPASGTVDYICAIHPTTMKGTVRVAGTTDGGNGEGGNDAPSLGLVGSLVALAGAAILLARRG